RIMLGGGDGAKILRIVALHTLNESAADLSGQERILAIGLLAATPARIAEDVDVGRPEIEALGDAVILTRPARHVELDPRLGADGDAHLLDARRVKGGGQTDRFGK